MITKGIRGAITVEENTKEAVKTATIELLEEMVKENNIDKNFISHVIFTLTSDLNAEFPAKLSRLYYGLDKFAMLCYHQLDFPNSLKKCLRVLIVLNCEDNFKPKFVYLKGAEKLRK